jgi:purine-cytosine permease-like protein
MADDKFHDLDVVPSNERRGPLIMGLIWLSMVTGSPSVLAGFSWHAAGISLWQVIICTVTSCLILLIYSIPATDLGAKSGQSYSMLCQSAFGRLGSYLVRFNLLWIFLFWYGWIALFVGNSMKGLYGLGLPTAFWGALFAILMAAPNFFGFSGVANVSRYLSAPVLITWVLFCFFKAINSTSVDVLSLAPHLEFNSAMTTISAFVIGFAIWGNEPDYWRYSKPNRFNSGAAIFIALLIGQVTFPITGWLLGHMSGIGESAAAFKFLNQYSLAAIPFLAVIVLLADNVAANDSNLFGLIVALRSLRSMSHKTAVFVLAVDGALVAACLAGDGVSRSLQSVASLNSVFVPTPTVIMLAEWFLTRRRPFFTNIVPFKQLPFVRWPALIALLAGCAVGALTSGVIPGTEPWHVGICSIQAWLTALVIYVPLRLTELAKKKEPAFEQATEPLD